MIIMNDTNNNTKIFFRISESFLEKAIMFILCDRDRQRCINSIPGLKTCVISIKVTIHAIKFLPAVIFRGK